MIGWIANLLGGIAVTVGGAETATILIAGGMIAHWRFWLMALSLSVAAFLIGFHSH